jgi:hypothetical protein
VALLVRRSRKRSHDPKKKNLFFTIGPPSVPPKVFRDRGVFARPK